MSVLNGMSEKPTVTWHTDNTDKADLHRFLEKTKWGKWFWDLEAKLLSGLPFFGLTWGWSCELAQRLTAKEFQTGRVIFFGARHLVNRACNMVTNYILVRCTYPNPTAPFYSSWWVTHKGAAHRNLLPVLSSASKPRTGFTPIGRSF